MLIIPEHIIEQTMQTVIDRWLLPKFNELGMNATGEWKENVHALAEPNKGIISGRDYTESLVNGYKGFVPIQDLYRWGMAKFHGNFSMNQAYYVQQKIIRVGTSWYEQGGTDLLEILNQPEVTDFVNQEIGTYVRTEAQIQIVRDLKEVFA